MKDKQKLFKNTREAVAFGEKASLDDMSKSLNELVGTITSKMVEISFELLTGL